jgi:hypothetical protein
MKNVKKRKPRRMSQEKPAKERRASSERRNTSERRADDRRAHARFSPGKNAGDDRRRGDRRGDPS